jgi:5,6-dimethylbenzimidazole synthase
VFSADDRDSIYRAIFSRRDMRHFRNDPVDEAIMQRLFAAAHAAPSVGFMQPWRFIRISDTDVRRELHRIVDLERDLTRQALGERGDAFSRLKVEGILDCAEIVVVTLCENREPYVFGRRTLPEMDICSCACAIQNLWLAARAEGIGVGWVSLFDPERIKNLLAMPVDAHPLAILCIGHVDAFYDSPMLAQEGWDTRRALNQLIMHNRWQSVDGNSPIVDDNAAIEINPKSPAEKTR